MPKPPIVLFIGSVFPEPKSSAAGTRILQLVRFFQNHDYTIVFGSSSKKTEHSFDLESIGVKEVSIQLNASSFDEFVKELNPYCVVFDRFMTEEQYGWRVAHTCPNTIRILDTEDLHFLRKERENLDLNTAEFSKEYLKSDIAKRELASIYRSDLSLIISEIEFNILSKQLNIDASLLLYLPFLLHLEEILNQSQLPDFEKRKDFVFVGGFIHPPNVDAVMRLKTKIWPKLRKKHPGAYLHIFGSYPKPHHLNLQNTKEKFLVHGFVEDLDKELSNSRVLLAPLKFGAGLKGKVIDAMRNGTPCVLSKIAAEGIFSLSNDTSFISENEADFIEQATKLYLNESVWTTSQKMGFKVIKDRFLAQKFYSIFIERICFLDKNLDSHRLQNFTGILLQHHTMQSTKYFSKWIEAKNRGF